MEEKPAQNPVTPAVAPTPATPATPITNPVPPKKASSKKPLWIVLILVVLGVIATGAYFVMGTLTQKTPPTAQETNSNIRIAFALGDLREERWQKDRDLFVEAVEKQGANVQVFSANSDGDLQNTQIKNMVTQGFDVIVILPYDSTKITEGLALAKKANIKILSYDRLILGSKVDFYITFDNVKVGYLQATGVTAVRKSGNFAYIGGAPTDNNAKLLKQGTMEVLDPLIKDGSIKLVVDEFTPDWKPEIAYNTMKKYLATGGKLDAVVAANDATAFGAIKALKEYNLAGKIPVSGQDAELVACQQIIAGTQTLTVYKPIPALAIKAAEIAIQMAKGETPNISSKINNGILDVPSYFLEPVLVTKDNMDETVIKDGYHTKAEVYQTTK